MSSNSEANARKLTALAAHSFLLAVLLGCPATARRPAPPAAAGSPVSFVSLTPPELLEETDARDKHLLVSELRGVIDSHLPELEACVRLSANAGGERSTSVQVDFRLDRNSGWWAEHDGVGLAVLVRATGESAVSGPVDGRCVELAMSTWNLPQALRWDWWRDRPFRLVYDSTPSAALVERLRGELSSAYQRTCVEFPWSKLKSAQDFHAAYGALRRKLPMPLRARLDGLGAVVSTIEDEVFLRRVVADTFSEVGQELGTAACPAVRGLAPQ